MQHCSQSAAQKVALYNLLYIALLTVLQLSFNIVAKQKHLHIHKSIYIFIKEGKKKVPLKCIDPQYPEAHNQEQIQEGPA